ncbi:hypothetical protein [Streptomyces bluensis]|uniref:hypothetical protein n=1 Tax=Streptomyces bluensis TaxID=33897 RepID=UPI003322F1E2
MVLVSHFKPVGNLSVSLLTDGHANSYTVTNHVDRSISAGRSDGSGHRNTTDPDRAAESHCWLNGPDDIIDEIKLLHVNCNKGYPGGLGVSPPLPGLGECLLLG